MKEEHPDHKEQIVALKRIEGQVRGLQKMIDEERYCVDILTQTSSVVGALYRVQDKILEKHFQMCINKALKSGSDLQIQKKTEEMLSLVKKFRRNP